MEPPKLKKANRMWWQIWLGRLINTARAEPPLPLDASDLLARARARQRPTLRLARKLGNRK